MCEDRKNTFSILCIVLAVVIYFGCCGTAGAKAFTYKNPVKDPDIHVDIYNPDKTWHGTTLLANNHRPERPRIIEVTPNGEIVWRLRGKTKMEKGDAPRKCFYKAERIATQ